MQPPKETPSPGLLIRELRLALRLTQEGVAKRATDAGYPLTRNDVVKVETGANQATSDRARAGLAAGFGLSRDDVANLLDGRVGIEETINIAGRARPNFTSLGASPASVRHGAVDPNAERLEAIEMLRRLGASEAVLARLQAHPGPPTGKTWSLKHWFELGRNYEAALKLEEEDVEERAPTARIRAIHVEDAEAIVGKNVKRNPADEAEDLDATLEVSRFPVPQRKGKGGKLDAPDESGERESRPKHAPIEPRPKAQDKGLARRVGRAREASSVAPPTATREDEAGVRRGARCAPDPAIRVAPVFALAPRSEYAAEKAAMDLALWYVRPMSDGDETKGEPELIPVTTPAGSGDASIMPKWATKFLKTSGATVGIGISAWLLITMIDMQKSIARIEQRLTDVDDRVRTLEGRFNTKFGTHDELVPPVAVPTGGPAPIALPEPSAHSPWPPDHAARLEKACRARCNAGVDARCYDACSAAYNACGIKNPSDPTSTGFQECVKAIP